jgi:flagellar export protein FliJ
MKKFKFRLQRVLDIRTVQEKAKLTALGQERIKLDSEQRKLDIFVRESGAQIEQIRQEQSQPFRCWTQQTNSRYLKRLDRVIQFQKNAVNEQEKQVLRARSKYEKAHRDTESLEKVHDKKVDEWKLEVNREECIELDEHGTRSHTNGDRR